LQTVTVEQDFLDILLYSIPSTPDRTAFITGQSTESPLVSLIQAAKVLESAGASCIILPCATSHMFYNELSDAVSVPVLNILDETALYAKKQSCRSVRLLATDGTIKGRTFHSAFEKHGIIVNLLPENLQSDLMTLIYDIKCGVAISPDPLKSFTGAGMSETYPESVVLGCTELCVIANGCPDMINILDVLAMAALRECHIDRF